MRTIGSQESAGSAMAAPALASAETQLQARVRLGRILAIWASFSAGWVIRRARVGARAGATSETRIARMWDYSAVVSTQLACAAGQRVGSKEQGPYRLFEGKFGNLVRKAWRWQRRTELEGCISTTRADAVAGGAGIGPPIALADCGAGCSCTCLPSPAPQLRESLV